MAKNRKKFNKSQLIPMPKRIIQEPEEDLASQYDRRVRTTTPTVIVRRQGIYVLTIYQ